MVDNFPTIVQLSLECELSVLLGAVLTPSLLDGVCFVNDFLPLKFTSKWRHQTRWGNPPSISSCVLFYAIRRVSLSGLWVHMGWRKETQPVISATHPMLQTYNEMWSAISLPPALQIMASFLHNVNLLPLTEISLWVPSWAFIHSYLESSPFFIRHSDLDTIMDGRSFMSWLANWWLLLGISFSLLA